MTALTETLDGTGWHELTPTISATPGPTLTDLSCPDPTDCVGVGSTTATTGTRAAAGTLRTTTWTAHPPLDPPGAQRAYFTSVSCTAPDACTATGTALPSSTVAMAQHWDGHHWNFEPLPMPTAD